MIFSIIYISSITFSGSFACGEFSNLILVCICLVLIRYIESGKSFSVVASTDSQWYKTMFTGLGKWLTTMESQYPLWYRNLELGRSIANLLLDIAKAVHYKYSVQAV